MRAEASVHVAGAGIWGKAQRIMNIAFTDQRKFQLTKSFEEKYLITSITNNLDDVYGFFTEVKGETEEIVLTF